MNVIKRINELREARGWSIYTLAMEAGVTQSTLSTMLARNTPPKLDTLECICKAFGMTLAQFFAENEHVEYLSELECSLVRAFRNLPDEKKHILVDFLR